MYNKALDVFKTVADSGSFTKASEKLFISHTAVIKQINGLEAHLGVKLFQRTNQGAALTAAGQCLYVKAMEMIRFSEDAIRAVQDAHFASPKTIRVGTSLFYPCHFFMDLWDTISGRCPQYQLQMVPIEDDEQRLTGLNQSYDFLIGPFNAVSGQAFHFLPVGAYRFCLAVPRRHPLAKKRSLAFRDLSGYQLMIMRRGTSAINDRIRDDILSGYPQIHMVDIPPHYGMRTFNRCMEAGAILLSLTCWKDVHPGLATIALEEEYTLPYGILTARNASPDVQAFVAAVQKCLA